MPRVPWPCHEWWCNAIPDLLKPYTPRHLHLLVCKNPIFSVALPWASHYFGLSLRILRVSQHKRIREITVCVSIGGLTTRVPLIRNSDSMHMSNLVWSYATVTTRLTELPNVFSLSVSTIGYNYIIRHLIHLKIILYQNRDTIHLLVCASPNMQVPANCSHM
jgi:hypothetical protein